MTIPEAKRITRINEWSQRIHERQQSGQSVRAWCREKGIRENSYYYWLRIIREEALREAENRSGMLVRVEPEKLTSGAGSVQPGSGSIAIQTQGMTNKLSSGADVASAQPASVGIVIRVHGVEAEFPLGTDIGILAAFGGAISHA